MPFREAGLPRLTLDIGGDRHLILGSKAVVRTVHNAIRRVDIETEDGSLLTNVLVLGPYLPPVHQGGDQPSHVAYLHVNGAPDAFCWPIEWRRLQGPMDQQEGHEGEEQPERRRYDLHGYVFRSANISVRITHDSRWVIESEQGDYLQLDEATREVRVHAPSVFVGTEDASRLQYERDDFIKGIMPHIYLGTDTGDRIQYDEGEKVQVVVPNIFMGATGGADADGITYKSGEIIHLVSELIKFTAQSIVLDPVSIKFGNAGATERLILGDLFKVFLNTFFTAYSAHTHTGVQTGAGTTGTPTVPATPMDDSMLSTVAHTI